MTTTTRHVALGPRQTAVTLRRNARARRITLALDPASGGFRLTLPPGVPEAEGWAFWSARAAWAQAALLRLPEAIAFADGATIPFRGLPHRLSHRPDARGGAWLGDGEIHVAGRAEHFARRTRDFLRDAARAEAVALVRGAAGRLGVEVGRIAVGDQRSRWGSCSARGDIRLNWRLILAPDRVMAYVAAHEVAHRRHADHSPAFWAAVEGLHPDWRADRAWLRARGASLLRIG